jgi:hypothetical protein
MISTLRRQWWLIVSRAIVLVRMAGIDRLESIHQVEWDQPEPRYVAPVE